MSHPFLALLDLSQLEAFSRQESPIHRRHPAAKAAAVLASLILLITRDLHNLPGVLLWFALPLSWQTAAGLPFRPILIRLLPVLPLALAMGAFHPWLDPAPRILYGVSWRGGSIALAVIAGKALGSCWLVLLFSATTPLPELLRGLRCLGLPAFFARQTELLYRWFRLLARTAGAMTTARELRGGPHGGRDTASTASLLGNLILRTARRGEHIERALYARGWQGELPVLAPTPFRRTDAVFLFIHLIALGGLAYA